MPSVLPVGGHKLKLCWAILYRRRTRSAPAKSKWDIGFHPLAVQDSANRNQVPKIHRYDDHLFLVLHAPQPGAGGHVHYVELDQFIGDRYLGTVHGPLNPAVDPAAAMVEVDTVLARLSSGKLKQPDKAFELSHALLTALTGRLRAYTAELTKDVWTLEQRVTGDHFGDPDRFSMRCCGRGTVSRVGHDDHVGVLSPQSADAVSA